MIVLLDTSVVVDVLNARVKSRHWLHGLIEEGHRFASCAVTNAEVYAGMRRHEAAATEEFLDSMQYYETTRNVARRAGYLKAAWARKGQRRSITDSPAPLAIASTFPWPNSNSSLCRKLKAGWRVTAVIAISTGRCCWSL